MHAIESDGVKCRAREKENKMAGREMVQKRERESASVASEAAAHLVLLLLDRVEHDQIIVELLLFGERRDGQVGDDGRYGE